MNDENEPLDPKEIAYLLGRISAVLDGLKGRPPAPTVNVKVILSCTGGCDNVVHEVVTYVEEDQGTPSSGQSSVRSES